MHICLEPRARAALRTAVHRSALRALHCVHCTALCAAVLETAQGAELAPRPSVANRAPPVIAWAERG